MFESHDVGEDGVGGVIVDEVGEPFEERKDVLRRGRGSISGLVVPDSWKSDAIVLQASAVRV